MASSRISVKQPKKRGRPRTGVTPFVGVRFPEMLSEQIEAWAKKHRVVSKSEAIRRLVELGLKAKAR